MIPVENYNTWSRVRPALFRYAPVLLPFLLLVATGLRGLDFGLHWDERPWQIAPVKHMVQARTPLPGYYNYPSFDYWLNLLVLSPDLATSRTPGETLVKHLVRALDSHAYLMRLRAVYLVIGSFTLLWVYLLVQERRGSWLEALLAASLLACSWEIAYHLRWVGTDGILMQFAALTVLLAVHGLKTHRQSWLLAAAIVAGLGCGTKYPGGLLLLPVAMAAFLSASGCAPREKVVRLLKVAAVFTLVYLAVTPATLLQPAKVAGAVLYEMKHYSTGHGGHTVGRGLEHAWRMLAYFATVFFSPHLPLALLMFALGAFGLASMIARRSREVAVLLVFPLVYLLYFSTQRAMIVRNLLAVAPFLAIAAARGAAEIADFLSANRGVAAMRSLRANWSTMVWAGLLGGALCINAFWLIASAESIVERHTNRFVRDAANYVRIHSDTKFILSPRVKRQLSTVESSPANLTVDPAQADEFVLYAREGMLRWHDWPANYRGLTQAWFGPREVNFDMYPNWWGDDRIVVISRHRARQIGLHIAGVSPDTPSPEGIASSFSAAQHDIPIRPISANSLSTSWSLPTIDPRLLVPRAEVEAIIGPIIAGPASGGWELDGTACTYFGDNELVVSIAVISTAAYELQRHDPESVSVREIGADAYAIHCGWMSEVRLFARSHKSAVIIHLSGRSETQDQLTHSASQLAARVLERLDTQDRRIQ